MAVTSSLMYFFLATTLCTVACGLYVVGEKVWGSRDRLSIKRMWNTKHEGNSEAGRGNSDEVNVAQRNGASVM